MRRAFSGAWLPAHFEEFFPVAANLSIYTQLLEAISSRKARAGIIGLGYVGLPLAITIARAAFR